MSSLTKEWPTSQVAGRGPARRSYLSEGGSRVLFPLLALLVLAAPALADYEFQLVAHNEPEILVDKKAADGSQEYFLYPYSLTEGQREHYIGPNDAWGRNIRLNDEPLFEVYYKGDYIGRRPLVRRETLKPGSHSFWPGNHVFTVAEDGSVSTDSPEILLSTTNAVVVDEKAEGGKKTVKRHVIKLKCYPLRVQATNADPRAPKPRELIEEIPLPSCTVREANHQAVIDGRLEVAALAGQKVSTAAPRELSPNPTRHLWFRLWLPANTNGQGYVLFPLDHTFHLTPEGVVNGAAGPQVDGWRTDGYTLDIPVTPMLAQGDAGTQMRITDVQLLSFTKQTGTDHANLYMRKEPYEFRVAPYGPSIMIDGDLNKLPNKVLRVEWASAKREFTRGMVVESDARHLTLGQPFAARLRAIDTRTAGNAMNEATNAVKGVKGAEAAVKSAEGKVAAARNKLKAEQAKADKARAPAIAEAKKRDEIKARIDKLTADIAAGKTAGEATARAADVLAKATAALKAAEAAVAEAKKAVAAAETNAKVTGNQITAATAVIQAAKGREAAEKAAVDNAKKALADLTAKAGADPAAVEAAKAAVTKAEAAVTATAEQIRKATADTDVATARAKAEQDAIKAAKEKATAADAKVAAERKTVGDADKAHVLAKAASDKANVPQLTEQLAKAQTELTAQEAAVKKAEADVAEAVKAASSGIGVAEAAVKKEEAAAAEVVQKLTVATNAAAQAAEAEIAAGSANPLGNVKLYAKIRSYKGSDWLDLPVEQGDEGHMSATVPETVDEGIYQLRLGVLPSDPSLASLFVDQWVTVVADADVGVGLFSRRGRDAFFRGEPFWLAMGVVSTGDPIPAGTEVALDMVDVSGARVPMLRDKTKEAIAERKTYVVRFDADKTYNLAPGEYRAEPRVGDRTGPPLKLTIVDPAPETHFIKLLLGKYNRYNNRYSAVTSSGNGIGGRAKSLGEYPMESYLSPDDVVRSIKEAGYNAFKGMDYGMDRVHFPDSDIIAQLVRERPELGPWEAYAPSSGRDRFLNGCVRYNIQFYENLFTQHDSMMPRGEMFIEASERYATLEAASMRHQPAFRGVCSYDELSQSLDHDTAGIVMDHFHKADEQNYRNKYGGRSSSTAVRALDKFTGRSANRSYEQVEIYRTWPNHLSDQWADFNSMIARAAKRSMPDARNFTLARCAAHPGDHFGDIMDYSTMFKDLEMASVVGYKDMGGYGDFPASGPIQADVLRVRDDIIVAPMIYGLGTGPYSESNVRHAFFTLSQDVDGLTFFQFESDPAATKANDNYNGVRDIAGRLCTLYGDFFTAADRGYKKVAIYYSRDADVLSQRKPIGVRLLCEGLWAACIRAGFPADFLTDEQIQADKGMDYEAIFAPGWHYEAEVPPDTLAALKRLVAADKIVAVEAGSKLPVDGIERLESALDEIDDRLGGSFPKHLDFDDERWWNMCEDTMNVVRNFLTGRVEPAAVHNMLVGPDWLRCRQGEYLVMPNHASAGFTGNHMTLYQGPNTPTLTFPKRPPVCYDMLEMERVNVSSEGDRMTLKADLRYEPGKIYAFLPAAIHSVGIAVPKTVRGGEDLNFRVRALAEDGTMIDAGIPLEIVIEDGTGRVLRHVYRAAAPEYRNAYRVPLNLAGGKLILRARELISGKRHEVSLDAESGTPPTAVVDNNPVYVTDPEKIRRVFREDTAMSTPLFTTNDFRNAKRFVMLLRFGGGIATQHGAEMPDTLGPALVEGFSDKTKELLDAYEKRSDPLPELRQTLVDELNKIVTSGKPVYDPELVPPGIMTMEEGRISEATTADNGNLPDVNRLVLEAYFNRSLERRQPIYIAVSHDWAMPEAERLRAELESNGRRVRVVNILPWLRHPMPGWGFEDNVLVGLDGSRLWRGELVEPGVFVDAPLIIVGGRQALVHQLKARDLMADPFTENFPGAGRALLGWVPEAFSIEYDTIYVLAGDTEGLTAGVDALLDIENQVENAPARSPVPEPTVDPDVALVESTGAAPQPESFRDQSTMEDRVTVMDVHFDTGRVVVGTQGYGHNLFCFDREGKLLWKQFLPEHEVYYAKWIDNGAKILAATAHGWRAFIVDAATGKVQSKIATTEWPKFHGGRETATKVDLVVNPPLRQILILGPTGLMAIDYDGKQMWFYDRARRVVDRPSQAVSTGFASFGRYTDLLQALPSPDGARIAYNEFRYFASTYGFNKAIVPLYRNEPQILDGRTGKLLFYDDTSDPGSNRKWELMWREDGKQLWIRTDQLITQLHQGEKRKDMDAYGGVVREEEFIPLPPDRLQTGGTVKKDFSFVERYDDGGASTWLITDRSDFWNQAHDLFSVDDTRLVRLGRSGGVVCRDLATGEQLWRVQLPSRAIAVNAEDHHVIVGGADGTVARISPTGAFTWRTRLRDHHEVPEKDYEGYVQAAIARDHDSTGEFYRESREQPDDFDKVLRYGIDQLDNGGFESTNHWTATAGAVTGAIALATSAHEGRSAAEVQDGQLVTSTVRRKLITRATYLLEFHYKPLAPGARIVAGVHLAGPSADKDNYTVSEYEGGTDGWTFGRLAVKTMHDTAGMDVGFEAVGGKVLVDGVRFRPVRFPSANLIDNAELHKIEPTHPEDYRVLYNRIPNSLREDLMNANNVAVFMQTTPLGALVWMQDPGFMHNGRLDDVMPRWTFRANPIGFSVVLSEQTYISHLVLYFNNAMPETVYKTMAILANLDVWVPGTIEPVRRAAGYQKKPLTVGFVRGNKRRFVVVHFPETILTDNLKILPGHHRANLDTLTEIEVYGPVGGPETLANKSFADDPMAVPMFMGSPTHVMASLPEDLEGKYKVGQQQHFRDAPAFNSGMTVVEDLATLATAPGVIQPLPVTAEKKTAMAAEKAKRQKEKKRPFENWRGSTVTPITTPARYAKRLIVGSADYRMHAVGDNGTPLWAFETEGRVYSSPVPDKDEVYFGSDDGKLYKIDVDSGILIWEFATGDRVRSSPALSRDRVIVASWDGHVYAVDKRLGTVKWKTPIARLSSSSPAIHNNRVYIGDDEGGMHCLDEATGRSLWTAKMDDRISTGPLVAPEGVLFVGDKGRASFLGFDGKPVWEKDLLAAKRGSEGSVPRVSGQPCLTQTQIVVPSNRGVHVLKRADGTPDTRFTPPAADGHFTAAVPYGRRLCVTENKTQYQQGDGAIFIVAHSGMGYVWEPAK